MERRKQKSANKIYMSFESDGSLIIEFRSKIKIYSSSNVLVHETQYSGLDFDTGQTFMKWIHYNDSTTFDIYNGCKIYLYSQFHMAMEHHRPFDIKCIFEIVEL